MSLPLLIVALITILLFVYSYLRWTWLYWECRGVPTFSKNCTDVRETLSEAYTHFKSLGHKHGGVYGYTKPFYVPVDLDLIRWIMLKHFDHFVNHEEYVNEKADILSGHLFALRDDKWRNLRTKFTPMFTSGKLRMMFPTIVETTIPLINILKKDAAQGEPVDIKDVLARFTTDVIGSVAFGINCNSLEDPDCDFRKYGIEFGQMNWRRKAALLSPKSLLQRFNFAEHSPKMQEFFLNLVKKIIEHREANNIYRKDFIHLLLQIKNRGKVSDDEKIMDDDKKGEFMNLVEITAQCYVFFVGGFETSSSLMTFALLELAQEQDVQDKLRKEIQTALKKHDGFTYEAIMEMNYLDQVVSETLRLHPPAFATNRLCNKAFIVPDVIVKLEPGTSVLIPMYAIHHDPEYYPDPEKFDPDRFSPENKAGRHPFAYIPFGEGPRMCIGFRFGFLQSKVGLASILTNFKVTLNSKTSLPVEYDGSSMLLSVKGNVWLNFQKLED